MRAWLFAGMLVAAVAASACGGGDSSADRLGSWFEALERAARADPPTSDVMQLDLSASCDLVDELAVNGHELELVGAGVALYGSPAQGIRYQCAWTGDETSDRPANARLEVIRVHGAREMRAYRDLVARRPHATEVVSAGVPVEVAEVLPPPSGTRTFDAELIPDDDGRGIVRLLLEVTDLDLAEGFSAQRVADLLTASVGMAD